MICIILSFFSSFIKLFYWTFYTKIPINYFCFSMINLIIISLFILFPTNLKWYNFILFEENISKKCDIIKNKYVNT